MRFASVPPPMALHNLGLSENAIDIAVSTAKPGEHNILIAVLNNEGVAMYEWDVTAKPRKPPLFKWSTKVANSELPNLVHQQVSFSNEQTLSVLSSDLSGSAVFVVDIETGLVHQDLSLFREEIRGLVPQGVHATTSLVQAKDFVIEHNFPQGDMFSRRGQIRYPVLECRSPRVQITAFRDEREKPGLPSDELNDYIDSMVLLGLSSQGYLFAKKRILANNCTSFLVTPSHLIFTTSNHLLKFVHMAKVEGRHSTFLFRSKIC